MVSPILVERMGFDNHSPSLLILSLTAEGPAFLHHMNAVTSAPTVS